MNKSIRSTITKEEFLKFLRKNAQAFRIVDLGEGKVLVKCEIEINTDLQCEVGDNGTITL